MIAGLVMAAGLGTRFGGDKVLATLRGVPVVRHVVDALVRAGLAPIIVVAGASAAGVRAALVDVDAVVVVNPRPDDGLSASIRVGVDALPERIDAFVVALGDQPLVNADVVRLLGEMWRDSNAAAVVPEYRDGPGNPVLFDATMRRVVGTLAGDSGARTLLAAMGDRVVRLPVDGAAPRDIDTADDLRALES